MDIKCFLAFQDSEIFIFTFGAQIFAWKDSGCQVHGGNKITFN